MSDFWTDELTEDQEKELIQKAAQEIRKRKLQAPAVLMLEMHKPLAFLSSQAAIVFSPFLVPFLGFDNVNDYSRLFAKRDNIERLLLELEREEPSAPQAAPEA
jgi:positive regulator of sigma E activity